MVGGTVNAGMRGAQVRSTSWAVTSEVSSVEDESRRACDTSSDTGIPGSRGMTGNAMVKGVEVRSAGGAVA